MKKISLMLSLLAVALFTVGCDKIDDPHKPFTPTGGNKTVLITDFTGVRCVNCPGAAETVHEMQHQLGDDKVFIMSVHAGYLAQPMGDFPDFTTDEGTEWYCESGSNPLFAVDHVDLSSSKLNVDQVDAPLSAALAESQKFDIVISNEYDEVTRTLITETDVVAVSDVEGNFNLTSCIVEDSIIGMQVTPEGLNREYVHRNVFRETLNGAYGESFISGKIYAFDECDHKFEVQLDPTYNADQCYILSYIYDAQTKKIYQTAMSKIN